MEQSALQETKSSILIVDKLGYLGRIIGQKILAKNNAVFLVSGEDGLDNEKKPDNIVYIKYHKNKKKISGIPDIFYSCILIIWNGEKEIIDLLPQFIKKSQSDQTKFVFITNLYFTSQELIKKIRELHKKSTIFVFGDLFGGEPLLPTAINKVLYEAKLNRRIKIINSGLKKIYPIFLEDALSFILELIREKRFLERIFFLFPKHPPTQLSFSRMLQKIDPLISVDFVHKKDADKELMIPQDGDYLLREDYPLKERFKLFFDSLLKEDKIKKIENINGHTLNFHKEEIQKGKRNIFALIFFSLFSTLILPFLITILFSFLGLKFLMDTKNEIEKAKLTLAYKNISLSQRFFNFSLISSKMLLAEGRVINKEDSLTGLISDIEMAKEISSGISFSLNSFLKLEKTIKGQSVSPRDDFIDGLNNLKNAVRIFEKIQTRKSFLGLENDLVLKVNNLNQLFKIFVNTIDVLPSIFGLEEKKTYLVLFQNNMELRPTGGFIGSYGILTLNNGKIDQFNLFDVYDADGQLKGHVEPPFAIRRYLPSAHWYLRDSNFDIDFPKSASASAFFLKQEMNTVVDGVIAVDTTFVKNILRATGPVFVPEYNQTVTEDNFFMLAQAHAEKNFFPGSSQKKDFLRSLFNSIHTSFLLKQQVSYFSLMEAVRKSILEKHLLFAFSEPSIQNVFTVNKMSSALRDTRENTDDVINDFIGINETNLGVNKVNYFIKRKVDYQVFIDKEKNINGEIKILYKNTSKKDGWPGGDYKNYLRLILPLGAELNSIKIDGDLQKLTNAITDPIIYEAKGFSAPKELEIEKKVENGKTSYGFLINIPSEEFKIISISYNFPQKILSTVDVFSYNLIVFKQPGTDEDNFSSTISYPDSFRVINLPQETKSIDGKITWSTKILTDSELKLNFAKK